MFLSMLNSQSILRKERKMEYNYDHIIKILLTKAGWIRVPLYLPRKEENGK